MQILLLKHASGFKRIWIEYFCLKRDEYLLYKPKKNSWTTFESLVDFLLARCAVVSVSFLDTHNCYYFVN